MALYLLLNLKFILNSFYYLNFYYYINHMEFYFYYILYIKGKIFEIECHLYIFYGLSEDKYHAY